MTEPTTEKIVTAREFFANYGESPNDPIRKMWAKVEKFAEPLEDLYKTIKESSPPTPTELDAELKSSDDPQVIEFREELERLELALRTTREEAHKFILGGYHVADADELEKVKKSFNAASDNVKTTLNTMRKYADVMEINDVVPYLEKVEFPSLRGLGRVYSASGTKRRTARVEGIRIVRKDGRTKTVKRFSDASLFLSCETNDLVDEWLKAAKQDDWKNVSDVVEYTTQEHTLTVTPLSEVQTEIETETDQDDE